MSDIPHHDPYGLLAVETQAMLAAIQERQTETLAELAQTSARMTELLRRLAPLPGLPPRPTLLPATMRVLDRWRREHRLDDAACTVASYVLPRLLEQGALIAPPELIARRTGLTVEATETALRSLVRAGCLEPVAERGETTAYRMGEPHD
ncbi:hypothetical protein AB0M28_01050 [Streptomyces sp. NPDC051940]|uniref:hypothetical protein n=1 Tax=Streptomyces sp. NPDC051940 TaxID=3155675 RepID=UPI0034492E7C